jgi:hypothetical protein
LAQGIAPNGIDGDQVDVRPGENLLDELSVGRPRGRLDLSLKARQRLANEPAKTHEPQAGLVNFFHKNGIINTLNKSESKAVPAANTAM